MVEGNLLSTGNKYIQLRKIARSHKFKNQRSHDEGKKFIYSIYCKNPV